MANLSRGMCVEFTLSSHERIRGEITDASPRAGHWVIIDVDGAIYERSATELQHLSGSIAKSVKHRTQTLLKRKAIQRNIREVLEPQPYVPKRRIEPDKKRETGGWDGRPGYGERPEPQRFNADGQPIPPPPHSYASEIPYELHEHDEWEGEGYGCGLDWTSAFERYMDWSTGHYCNALADMERQDPRLKLVYILCVEQGHSSTAVAPEMGCSERTVRYLRVEAERIMGNRRNRAS